MKAKRIFEGYTSNMTFGNKGMVRANHNRFGKSVSKLSNMMPYVYQVLQFNHSLEQQPTKNDGFNPIKVGDVVIGLQFRNYKDKTKHKGVVTKVKKTVDGIVERVGINHRGTTMWLDPSTVVSVDNIDNNINRELILRDSSMDFDENE